MLGNSPGMRNADCDYYMSGRFISMSIYKIHASTQAIYIMAIGRCAGLVTGLYGYRQCLVSYFSVVQCSLGVGGWLVELGTGPFIIRGQRSNLQWEIYVLYGP